MKIDLRFENWELVLESASVRQYDDRVHTISVSGDYPEGWRWRLYVSVYGAECLNDIPLTEADGALTAVLARDDLAFGDTIYTLQLAGEHADMTRYCNPVRLYVGASLSGDARWPELPASFSAARAEAEAAAADAAASANEAAQTAASIEADLTDVTAQIDRLDGALAGKQDSALVGQAYSSGLADYLTPAQVCAALSAGRDVTVRYLDSVYGALVFTAWNVAESLHVVLANSIVYYQNLYLLYELAGSVTAEGGVWSRVVTPLQQALEVDAAPTAASQNPVASGGVYAALREKTALIPFGQVDATSTATAFTATVPGITELRDGVCVYLRNGRVTSAAGFTINVNGLGAKPVYQTLAAASAVTTLFNVNYTMLFIYNSTRVTGGCWDMFYGYNSNTTYSSMSQTEADAGTAASARTISAKVLHNAIGALTPKTTSALTNDSDFVTRSEMELAIASADGGEEPPELLGQTPLRLTADAALLLLSGEGSVDYALTSDTVADFDLAGGTPVKATVTQSDTGCEIRADASASAWYQTYTDVTVGGLTVGERYTLVFDAAGCVYNEQTHETVGHFILYDGGGNTLVTRGAADTNRLLSYAFTAPTASVRLRWYPATNNTFSSGVSVARVNRVYIDRAGATAHTPVVSRSGSFTGTTTLRGVPAGVTVTASPACAVYSKAEPAPIEGAKPLVGKTVVCFGDSLFGLYRGETSAPAFVADTTGATVHNVGFGGCRMSTHPTSGYAEFSMWALAKAVADGDWSAQEAAAARGSDYFPEQLAALRAIDFNAVDYVIIHYGTNDFGGGVALGESSPATDHSTLCGALRYSIETLLGAYPGLRIFVSLPVFRTWTSGGVTTDSDTYQNAQGKTLPAYVEAMRAVAREYHVPVIDGYYGLGVNRVNSAAFYTDGTHHNEAGRKRFGAFLGAQLAAQR